MLRTVQGVGCTGQILVAGFAPAEYETKPLSGQILQSALKRIGLLGKVRLENVVEHPAKHHQLTLANHLPTQELQLWHEDFKRRVDAAAPKVIVCLGIEVMQALTGDYESKLADVHGYIFSYKGIPVVPTYALDQVFHQVDNLHWMEHAFRKAYNLAYNAAHDEKITTRLKPTTQEILEFLERCESAPQLSIDLECIKESLEITAIAFATSPTEVMSVPFSGQHLVPYFADPSDEKVVWDAVRKVLASPNKKIFQNVMFDVMVFHHFGLETCGEIEDTLWIANLLNPELPKGLKDLGRQYLYCEPWKTQKDFTLTGDPLSFWQYNALDAARTFAIYEKQHVELKARNLDAFYSAYIKPVTNLALDTCKKGFAIDHPLYESFQSTIKDMTIPLHERLVKFAAPFIEPLAKRIRKRNKEKDIRGPSPKTGKEIVLEKGYDETVEPFNPASNAQVKLTLKAMGYRLPVKDGAECTDQIALLKLNRKKASPFIEMLLQYSKLKKLQTSYLNIAFEKNGRCMFTFNRARDNDNNLGTKSGRFGCSATPWGTGLNVQTIPRKNVQIPVNIKDIFVPDENMEIGEVDLNQAELRVVAWLSGDPLLITTLESGGDVHKLMAETIEDSLKVQATRDFGKFVNHSTAYGLGKYKFADKALKDLGMTIHPDLAQKIIDLRMQRFPMIRQWQQEIETTVRQTRRLVSPHGRERYFFGQFDDSMHREALSFIPQATVVDTINKAWIELSKLDGYGSDFNILAQVHDSLVFQVKTEKKDWFAGELKAIFARLHVNIGGMPRLIPAEVKMGYSWGSMKKLA